jgi:hypothetical protein
MSYVSGWTRWNRWSSMSSVSRWCEMRYMSRWKASSNVNIMRIYNAKIYMRYYMDKFIIDGIDHVSNVSSMSRWCEWSSMSRWNDRIFGGYRYRTDVI